MHKITQDFVTEVQTESTFPSHNAESAAAEDACASAQVLVLVFTNGTWLKFPFLSFCFGNY